MPSYEILESGQFSKLAINGPGNGEGVRGQSFVGFWLSLVIPLSPSVMDANEILYNSIIMGPEPKYDYPTSEQEWYERQVG